MRSEERAAALPTGTPRTAALRPLEMTCHYDPPLALFVSLALVLAEAAFFLGMPIDERDGDCGMLLEELESCSSSIENGGWVFFGINAGAMVGGK
mmetsp:Transcript_38133/g.77017  ORF Transcript_38133/g.77017 Transcript_38133/m.77017 type:complete len:95 (+) Transcript_38133:1191-1475(+)